MKYLTSIWSSIALLIILIGFRVIDYPFIEQTRLNTFDQYIKTLPKETSQDIVLLNIGEQSLEVYGQYPWPRQNYAQMISDIRNANAGFIGFTIMFPEADRFGGDEVFASWVKDNGIILSQDADENGRSTTAPYVGTAVFGTGDPYDYAFKYKGLVTNIDLLEQNAWGAGLLNGSPEVDNITRRIPLVSQINNQLYPSFALEIIRAMNDKVSYTLKVQEIGIEEIILRPFQIPTDSDGSIWLNSNHKFEEIEYTGQPLGDLQGKTVLVGVTAKGIGNQIVTPQGLINPHKLQASAMQTIINGDNISRPVWGDILEIILPLILGLIVIVAIYYAPIWVSSIIFLLALLGPLSLAYYAWNSASVLIDISYPLVTLILAFTSASFNNFYKQFKLRQQIKGQFSTYLSPDMVNMLVKDPSLMKLGGTRREMTFMFMDIVGFTPISEYYKNNDDPEGLVELINNYLDRMTKIILSHGGTIDKFMGDCIMAFWNAPLDCPDHAQQAVNAARKIEIEAIKVADELVEKGLPRVDIGIGINTGDCIVGDMGSETRLDYSVIGDAVNLGARLEGQTRNYDGVRVLLSEFTYKQCEEGDFKRLDSIKVKGKEEPVTIYTC